jgi:hypothetical protein
VASPFGGPDYLFCERPVSFASPPPNRFALSRTVAPGGC